MFAKVGRRRAVTRRALGLLVAIVLLGHSVPLRAEPAGIQTQPDFMGDLIRSAKAAETAPLDVFYDVLKHFGAETFVYPTENYLYFRFTDRLLSYRGNLRFDIAERDQGKLRFVYYVDEPNKLPNPGDQVLVLDQTQGIRLTRLDDCKYEVSFRDVTRGFALNCYRDWTLKDVKLLERETLIGPVFDESGFEFFLTYSYRHRKFLFNLANWTEPRDVFFKVGCCLYVGRRTGFVFLTDDVWGRSVLVGVRADSVARNDFYDGPFDQLPDNSLTDDRLRDAILDHSHRHAKVDRYGNLIGEDQHRYLVADYELYRTLGDLKPLYECLTKAKPDGRKSCILK